MKCLEKLVRSHIMSSLPSIFDQQQLAYWAKRPTEDTVVTLCL